VQSGAVVEAFDYRGSRAVDVASLRPLCIRELRIPFVHVRASLVCKLVTALKATGVVEDSNGDCLLLSLQNYVFEGPIRPGAIFIVKEPVIKYGYGRVALVDVQSPSDLVVVHESNEQLLHGTPFFVPCTMGIQECVARALEHLRDSDAPAAIRQYDIALSLDPGNLLLLWKKAKALASIQHDAEAYEFVIAALPGLKREKALRALADLAYRLRNWPAAVQHFQELTAFEESREFATDGLQRATERVRESETGEYDLRMMIEAVAGSLNTQTTATFDVADYHGPFEIRDIPGKGRGMVATADIALGSLVIAEKVFAVGYEREDTTMHEALFARVATIIQKDPHKSSLIYSLHPGSDIDRNEPIPDGVVDPVRIRTTININCFAWGDCELFLPIDRAYYQGVPPGVGVMIVASLVNHSCMYNMDRLMLGDMIFFRASQDVRCGDELTIPYNRDTWDNRWSRALEARQSMVHWFPQCDCSLCEAMANGPNCERVLELLQLAEGPVKTDEDLAKRVEWFREADRIYETYPAKPFLGQFALDIANEYVFRDNWQEALPYCRFAADGARRLEARVTGSFTGAKVALHMNDRREASAMLARAYRSVRRFSGLDFDAFVWLYTPMIRLYCGEPDHQLKEILDKARQIGDEMLKP
jgi:tetratricopeptide (TPR) repeat protein